jgi:hypothetical protein
LYGHISDINKKQINDKYKKILKCKLWGQRGLNPGTHGEEPCALPTGVDKFCAYSFPTKVLNTSEHGAKICGAELGATSVPRRLGVPA